MGFTKKQNININKISTGINIKLDSAIFKSAE